MCPGSWLHKGARRGWQGRKLLIFMRFQGVSFGSQHEIWSKQHNGKVSLFLFVEPQTGERHVHVTEQRTKVDFAHEMQWLVDICYPEAEVIRVVLDNLNTHKIASLYEAFEPAEARRIARKLELHYTPKHGSWLNMAEIELSVLQQQCLDRR